MAIKVLRSYRPDGSCRSIWRDQEAEHNRAHGVVPRRASRVEVIEDGPHRGLFSVDFSLLADLTDDRRMRVCLARPFATYGEAVAAEVAWIEKYWVLG